MIIQLSLFVGAILSHPGAILVAVMLQNRKEHTSKQNNSKTTVKIFNFIKS